MLAIQRKDKNQKGFTLAELLVVVAIIAVLVAVSIPIFTAKLEKAREATDIANMRAAKAIAATDILQEDYANYTSGTGTYTGYYDAANGVMKTAATTDKYGKGTIKKGGSAAFMGYTEETVASGKVIKVVINTADDTITETWE